MLIVLLSMLCSVGYTCTSVESMVEGQFRRHYMLTRRGAPGNMASAYFREYFFHLVGFARRHAHKEDRLGSVCLDYQQQKEFERVYDQEAIDKMIKWMYSLDPALFFLPRSMYSDEDLHPFSPALSRSISSHWKAVKYLLQKAASDVQRGTDLRVPGGVKFFFDPAHNEVCESLKRIDDGISKKIDAVKLSYEVIAIVIRLKLLGVPDKHSLQILKHHAAFTFNNIRCTRRNTIGLKVTGVYMPWYEEAFKKLTAHHNISAVPEISIRVIEDRFNRSITVLDHFKGWGQMQMIHFNEESMAIRKTHLSDFLFNSKVLEGFRENIRKTTGKRDNMRHRLRTGRMRVSNFHPISRPQSCKSGYFYYSDTASCCPQICNSFHVLVTVSPKLTTPSCCRDSASGSLSYASRFKGVSQVPLHRYGYTPPAAIDVMNNY